MRWVVLDKRYYFLQDAAVALVDATADHDDQGYVRTWIEWSEGPDPEPRSPTLDPTRVEFTGLDAHDAAGRILDGWCRLHEGRAYEVTYRTPGVLYLITPRLRMNIPTRDIRRIVVEAGNESPTVLVDTKTAVIMLGMDSAELSLIPGDAESQP